jgi:hypothetical protein
MEAVYTSETSIFFQKATQQYITEGHYLNGKKFWIPESKQF